MKIDIEQLKADIKAGVAYKSQRCMWVVDLHHIDGCGMGKHEGTIEKASCQTKEGADLLVSKWESEGKIKKLHWGGYISATNSYTSVSVHPEWQQAPDLAAEVIRLTERLRLYEGQKSTPETPVGFDGVASEMSGTIQHQAARIAALEAKVKAADELAEAFERAQYDNFGPSPKGALPPTASCSHGRLEGKVPQNDKAP